MTHNKATHTKAEYLKLAKEMQAKAKISLSESEYIVAAELFEEAGYIHSAAACRATAEYVKNLAREDGTK